MSWMFLVPMLFATTLKKASMFENLFPIDLHEINILGILIRTDFLTNSCSGL